MFIKPALSFVALCALASFGIVACSASTDDASQEPEAQDQDIKKSITSCSDNSDCVAVPRGGCCNNGYNEAVNKHHTKAYESSTKCTANPRPFCPLFFVNDTRVAQCDTAARQCKMVAIANTAAIVGSWGATPAAIMTVTDGHANIEFGCGNASIDSFTWSNPTTFTATGTQTSGTGVQPPPGFEPKPQAATFTGNLTNAGKTLTLTMTVAGNTQTFTFIKDKQINLIRCL